MKADEKTLALIEEVKNKKAEIAKIQRPNWLTNCSFSYQPKGRPEPINLHVVSDVFELINIVAFLNLREQAYEDAVDMLQVEVPTFEWYGHLTEEWIADVKTRIDQIQLSDKKKKLEILEKRLDKIISPELKRQMELEAIEAELNG